MKTDLPPLRHRLRTWLWNEITWPWQARRLKSAGFRRTGWRRWESP